MFAIVDFKGSQFRAEKDRMLQVPYIKDGKVGSQLSLKKVLLLGDGKQVKVGKPYVDNVVVLSEIVSHKKAKKVIVFKKKRRKGYRKKQGHRQQFSELKILKIDVGE